ncbi:MAG: hypothetical protein WCO35_02860 [Candidatus Nomurabacteria bacterium]
MLPNFSNDTNIPLPGTGVHNEFVAPISGDIPSDKDSLKIILMVMLVVTIVLAILSFVYTGVLKSQINNKQSQLSSYDNSPNVSTFDKNLDDMRSLSQKLKLLNSVYDNKLYVSSMLFPILESIVESDSSSYVYFNKFNLKKEDKTSLAGVSLSGVAKDYVSLYRQIDSFKTGSLSKNFSNFKLVSLSLDQNGNVLFDISFDIDISTKNFLGYLNNAIGNIDTTNSTSSNPSVKNDIKSGPLYKAPLPANIIPLMIDSGSSSNSSTISSSSVPTKKRNAPVIFTN